MLSCIRSGRASTKEMTTRASSPDETLSGMQAFEPLGGLPAKCLAVNDDAAAQANLIPSRRCPEAALMRANTCTSAVKHVRSAIPNLRRAVRVHRPAVARIVHAVNRFVSASSPEADLCFIFSQPSTPRAPSHRLARGVCPGSDSGEQFCRHSPSRSALRWPTRTEDAH
jgi:hypothetical protein